MTNSNCPVVGIGASAGGLAALKALFKNLPENSGAAFVVIQHLDPKHASLTAEILTRSTCMPAVQVEDGMQVKPNHLYVIPPNAYLTLQENSFVLSEAVLLNGLRMPIDTFFWSLAEQREERGIAIIVSGTGSDGTLGVRAVKGNNGLVIVQSPETAQYDGMPNSAIATGLVDVVCSVGAMGEHLAGYLQHPFYLQVIADQTAKTLDTDVSSLNAILAVLHNRTGHDFRDYKQGTLQRRIARRMGLHRVDSMADYLKFLRRPDQKNEITLLFKDLLIGVTAFFRDQDAFDALSEKVLAPLLKNKDSDAPIRFWVPGCSSGEEAYSLAMLLREQVEAVNKHCPIQIFATDIDEFALSIGRTGLYPQNIAASVSSARLQRFFSEEDHSFRVNKALRETVTFAVQDLISDPPFSNLDLISCRNLLIYLKADVQRKALALFHFALRTDGYLLLGHSETIGTQEGLFVPLVKKWRIFQRVGSTRAATVDFPIGKTAPRLATSSASGELRSSKQSRFGDIAQRHLLQEYAPAAVLVDDQYQVLHFCGPTARYLEQPVGAPTHNLLNLVRPEMRTKLRAALAEALAESHGVTLQDTHLMRAGERVRVKVSLKPLTTPRLLERIVLITFEDLPAPASNVAVSVAAVSGSDAALLKQLEYELNATRGELQSNIEEKESANEELQAANEEVMSVNEEMQSSNEELETSKEELQSMNEELSTVNNQLKDKVDELSQTNNDLANLLSSTEIATLFLDTELRVRRFTPPSKRLFNLIATDIGRPLSDIHEKYSNGDLLADAQLVLERLTPVETEVYTESGEFYLRRVLPYRTVDDHIVGVVVTFVEFTALKRADAAMQLAKTAAESANATKTRFLATASHDLRQPLQSLNLLNAALLKIIDNDKAQRMLTLQGESLLGMGRLLNSLLDISKLESGAVSVNIRDIALRPIVGHLVDEFAVQARNKGLQLSVAIAGGAVDDDLRVRSDPVLLAQVLQNLIANAIRYTAQGFVQIDCERKGDSVQIMVRDSGVGIPADQLTHIFEEFHQVDRDPQERHGGLGLGLSIAQRIATLLNTNIKVHSEVGEGSTFSLALIAGNVPRATAQLPKQEVQPRAGTGAIFLIDDEPHVLAAASELLGLQTGLTVHMAASPSEAYALLEQFTPELIITDLHLGSSESGIEIVRAARKRAGRMIPAVVATGDTTVSVEEFDLKDVQLMIKPLDVSLLLAETRRILSAEEGSTGASGCQSQP